MKTSKIFPSKIILLIFIVLNLADSTSPINQIVFFCFRIMKPLSLKDKDTGRFQASSWISITDFGMNRRVKSI